jgi:4-alpha-glucanotransferase
MTHVFHALVLNFHQPAGNLEHLLEAHEWEARQILFALDRMPRSVWTHENIARVHVSLSGTLLETLSSPEFQQRVYGIVKCGDLLWHLQNQTIFRILGTAYYHPVLPLIPREDWDEQLMRWRGIARHLFWREQFSGFWPPEMGFCMEMIPALKRMGYRYVLVDSEHVEPVTPMRWEELRYRPHFARYGGDEIVVVVRDRGLSDAQIAGADHGWFMWEVHERAKHCRFPALVTTCTDGENGGWFRNVSDKGNFWGVLYRPLLERVQREETEIRPIFIDDYLDRFGADGQVHVRTGAWNTGWHHGIGFQQWTGSAAQKEALSRIAVTSDAVHGVRRRMVGDGESNPELWNRLEQAQWRLLRSQTSCNFFWGEDMVNRCHRDLDGAWHWLQQVAGS